MAKQTVDPRRMEALKNRIDVSFLTFEFARSSGPGGQNVNKVNSQVALWFDVAGCPALRPIEKSTLRRELAGRITNEGWLRIVSRKHRTQLANRRAATERFYELLTSALTPQKKRVPTRVSAGQKRRRREDKQRLSEKKQGRRSRSVGHDE
jgi:ribosome-associated protein